jgi:hypothetical protein
VGRFAWCNSFERGAFERRDNRHSPGSGGARNTGRPHAVSAWSGETVYPRHVPGLPYAQYGGSLRGRYRRLDRPFGTHDSCRCARHTESNSGACGLSCEGFSSSSEAAGIASSLMIIAGKLKRPRFDLICVNAPGCLFFNVGSVQGLRMQAIHTSAGGSICVSQCASGCCLWASGLCSCARRPLALASRRLRKPSPSPPRALRLQ